VISCALPVWGDDVIFSANDLCMAHRVCPKRVMEDENDSNQILLNEPTSECG